MTGMPRLRRRHFALIAISCGLLALLGLGVGIVSARGYQVAYAPTLLPKGASSPLKPQPTSTPMPRGPTLYISYREGAPGSLFTLSGLQFPADQPQSVWINGHLITVLAPNPGYSSAWFIFHLNTQQADQGSYLVQVQTQSATTLERFRLDAHEPVRQPIEGPGFDQAPVFSVPDGIAFTHGLFVPFIIK
jgi:hypothetical protein